VSACTAEPVFKQMSDRPYDVNATVGQDVVFHCNAYAIPDVSVVWYRNGQQINRMFLSTCVMMYHAELQPRAMTYKLH